MSQNTTAESVELTRLSAYPSIYPLSSPVSRALIISELLRTIFLFCVADDGEGPRYTDPRPWSSKHSRRRYPLISKMEAPLLLAHICRSWRRTALDTSQLWACFHIHLPEYVLTRPSTAPCSSLVDRRLTALKFLADDVSDVSYLNILHGWMEARIRERSMARSRARIPYASFRKHRCR